MPVVMHDSVIDVEMRRAADRWADRVGSRVVNAAKAHCPVDEGRLRASIEYAVDHDTAGRVTVTVGSPLEYAAYFHTGTGIYGPTGRPITPVTAKALKFKYSGAGSGASLPKSKRGIVFAKSVRGMPANPFLAKGLRDVFGSLAESRVALPTVQ